MFVSDMIEVSAHGDIIPLCPTSFDDSSISTNPIIDGWSCLCVNPILCLSRRPKLFGGVFTWLATPCSSLMNFFKLSLNAQTISSDINNHVSISFPPIIVCL